MTPDVGALRLPSSAAPIRKFLGPYEAYYSARNPFFKESRPLTTGQVFDESIVPDKVLPAGELLQRLDETSGRPLWRRNRRVQRWAASSIISTWRGARVGRMSDEDMRLLHTLEAAVQRSLQIHRRLTAADERCRVSVETLDLVAFGIILLDASGKISLMNRAATAMANRGMGSA